MQYLRSALRFLAATFVLYFLVSLFFIYRVAYTDHHCRLPFPNTPTTWQFNPSPKSSLAIAGITSLDTKRWKTPHYTNVSFPSRKDGITISGWYTEIDKQAPVVIVSHGIKPNCKANSQPLMAMALLTQAGMNVLNIDLQNYGDSTHIDSFIRLGQHEYLDILGAFDWLTTQKGYSTDQVGLAGLSLGAVTSAIAFSQEPAIKAIWLDSPFVDFDTMFTFELSRYHLPAFFKYGVNILSKLLLGTRPDELTCRDALRNADGRAIFLTQGEEDVRIPISQGQTFAELAEDSNAHFETWFVPETDHVDAMFLYPYTYQDKMRTFFNEFLG